MDNTRLKMMEAIARRKTVTARYNGKQLRLAPHLLFARRGDLFVSAWNMDKNWRSDEDPKLGQFKLDGLSGAELANEAFDPLPTYDKSAPRSDDELVLAVE